MQKIRRAANAIGGGYDAADSSTRRKQVSTVLSSEDKAQNPNERRRLLASARDARRNFSAVAWAVRKHVDFVSTMSFRACDPDDEFNERLEAFVAKATKPENFDIAGRYSLDDFARLIESSRTVDGDVFILKHNSGHVQAIEGDRIRDPEGGRARMVRDQFTHGIRVNRFGRALEYAVHDRNDGRYEFRTTLNSNFFWHIGYFDRFDQYRGVSPLASGLNQFRDVYEGIGYALAKAKVAQMFALVFMRDAEESLGDVTSGDDGDDKSEYAVDFGKGPLALDLDAGDDAKILTADTPGDSFVEFHDNVLATALKCLDIPFSFYNESFTNFYGSRGGMIHYVESCRSKRRAHVDFRDSWLRWRLAHAIREGEFDMGGRSLDDIKCMWVPPAIPLWDITKEGKGLGMMAAMGAMDLERIATEYGHGDIRTIIRSNAAIKKFAEEQGLPLILPDKTVFSDGDDEPIDDDTDTDLE